MTERPIMNIAEVPLQQKTHGETFCVAYGRMGPAIGLTALGCALHVVAPGKRAFPFHAHHVADELFYVVSGSGEYRYGDNTYPVHAGDVIGAPAGKTAHQLVNTSTDDLRYLAVSTAGTVDVVEYPDSKKYAVAAGVRNADFKTATFVNVAKLAAPIDYWEGEA